MSSISWPDGKLTYCEGRYWNGTDFSWKQNGVGERWHSIEIPGSSSTYENLNYVYAKTKALAVFRELLSLSSGEKCTAIKYEVYVHPSSGSALNHKLHCHLYTSDPTYASANVDYIPSGEGYPSGYIGSASVQHTFTDWDEYKKLTFNFTGLNIKANTDLYFYFTNEPLNGATKGEHVLTYGKYGTKYPVATPTFKPNYTLSVSPASVTVGNKVTITIGNGSGTSITARIKYGNTQLWSGTTTTGSVAVTVPNSWFTTAGVTGHSMSLKVTIDQDTSLSKTFTAVKNYTLAASPSSVATGSNVSITVGNGSGTSITARIKYGNTQLWSGTSTTGSFSVAVNKAWFTTAGITTAKSMALTVSIDQDTSLSASFTATAGTNMNPTAGALSFTPVNSGRVATNFPNSYIAGYSKVKVAAAVTAGSNAAISSVVLSFPGGSNVTMTYNSSSGKYEGTTAAVINGNTTFTVTAKDARSMSGSKQGTLSGVVAYVKPSVTPDTANCYRCNSSGARQDGGPYARVKATATWYSSLSGNALTSFLFYIKEDKAAGYNYSVNLTSGKLSSVLQIRVPGESDYVTVVFQIQDKVSDVITRELRLPALRKNIYIRRSADGTYVGIGMEPKRKSGISDIELPEGGAVLIGGFLDHGLSRYHSGSRDGSPFNKDFLDVNHSNLYDIRNTTVPFYKPANASGWSNCPVANTSGFIGVREVLIYNLNNWMMVRIFEMYPTAGRIWTNVYDPNNSTWKGWKSITPA